MVRLGGVASTSHMIVFQGLEELFRRRGIELEWALYSSHEMMVDAFAKGEIDLSWNGPLGYVRTKRRVTDSCRVIAMRDEDVDFITHFITRPDSDITTVEDLKGKRFAFGSRGSVQAGLLAYHFLKEVGINPRQDLASFTFYDQRPSSNQSDERDVIQRVLRGEYDAGSVCQRTLEVMTGDGSLQPGGVRIFWSSPGYSHCCFAAQGNIDPAVYRQVEQAFLSVDYNDPLGKVVLDAEGCKSFVPGMTEGWETLERVAEEEGLI